jgi:hypothetical protein
MTDLTTALVLPRGLPSIGSVIVRAVYSRLFLPRQSHWYACNQRP